MDLCLTAVDPDFGKKKVGLTLAWVSLKLAKAAGYTSSVAQITSDYNYRVGRAFGGYSVFSIKYADWIVNGCRPLAEIPKPHLAAHMMYQSYEHVNI